MPTIFVRIRSFFGNLFPRMVNVIDLPEVAENIIPNDLFPAETLASGIDIELIKKLFNAGETSEIVNRQFLKYEVEGIDNILQPGYYGKLILAKYYELKYGIKMAIEKDKKSFGAMKDFIVKKCEESTDFTFGFILLTGENRKYPVNEYYHCSALVFEKKSNQGRLIILDPVHNNEIFIKAHNVISYLNSKLNNSDLKLEVITTDISVQRDSTGCHNYAVFMLKDALRLEDVRNLESLSSIFETTEMKHNFFLGASQFDFKKWPTDLSKYSQVMSPDEVTTDSVVRSSKTKPEKSLTDYRNEHDKYVKFIPNPNLTNAKLPDTKIRNLKLLKKGLENPDRVTKVLDLYGITDEKGLIQFCKKLDGEQIKSLEDSTFLNTEIIDKLPAWSHLDDEKIINPPLDHGETKDESYFIEESAPIPVIRIPTKHPVILEKNAMGKSQNNENEIA